MLHKSLYLLLSSAILFIRDFFCFLANTYFFLAIYTFFSSNCAINKLSFGTFSWLKVQKWLFFDLLYIGKLPKIFSFSVKSQVDWPWHCERRCEALETNSRDKNVLLLAGDRMVSASCEAAVDVATSETIWSSRRHKRHHGFLMASCTELENPSHHELRHHHSR